MEVLEGRPDLKKTLENKDFFDVLKEPQGQLEETFVDTVKCFAEKLKKNICHARDFNLDDIVEGLRKFQSNFEEIIHFHLKFTEQLEEKLSNKRKTDEGSLENHENPNKSLENSLNPLPSVESSNEIPEPTRAISPTFITNETSDLELKIESKDPFRPSEESLENIEKEEETYTEDLSNEVFSNLFSRILEIFYKDGRNLQNLFESIDVSKDGKITCQELRVELLKHDQTITQEECEEVFKILDGNKDGSISLDELQKRIRLIHEKAEAEAVDPLAHMVFSKSLDPSLIHGSLSVILQKVSNMKPGTHSVKIKVKDSLEYLTSDTTDTNPNFNFRCEFLFENKTLDQIPKFVEFELYNKGKIEGTGAFNWSKAMKTPNSFSLKVKTDAKTSTGQIRGTFFFSVKWTPIVWKEAKREDSQKLEALKVASENHKRNLSQKEDKEEKKEIEDQQNEDLHDVEDIEIPDAFERSSSIANKPGEFFYVVEKTSKVIERSFTGVKKTKGKSGNQSIPDKDNTFGKKVSFGKNRN